MTQSVFGGRGAALALLLAKLAEPVVAARLAGHGATRLFHSRMIFSVWASSGI